MSRTAELNYRQRLFVAEYLVDLNATQAAIRAGYSSKTASAIGTENLGKPAVQAAIDEGFALKARRAEVTADRVVAELACIAFSNMGDYMRTSADGDPIMSFADLTREQTAALSEVTVEDFVDGRGDDARDVKRIKFKLHDKKGALVDLGKTLGLFRDRVEHSGPNGGPIETNAPDPQKLAQVLLGLVHSKDNLG